MSRSNPCPGCGADTPDGLLCAIDTKRLLRDLDALPEWLGHLDDALARQTQAGTGNGGRKGETPVPFDTNASRVHDDVKNTLGAWVRELFMGDGWPADHPRAMVRWLRARIERIRGHAAAGELADEIGYCVVSIKHAVDTDGPRWYLGVCRGLIEVDGIDTPCAAQLYAPAGSDGYRCPRCDEAVDVNERRDEMLSLLEHQHATPEVAVSVLTLFGLPAELRVIRRWIATGSLATIEGKCRVGDVADIARDQVAGVARRVHG